MSNVAVAILPLTASPELSPMLDHVRHIMTEPPGTAAPFTVDSAGLITDRLVRHDTTGTPVGVVIDFESLRDGCVVVRDRLTGSQTRTPLPDLRRAVAAALRAAPERT
jgi:glycyl-tRNA synthetase (class II)